MHATPHDIDRFIDILASHEEGGLAMLANVCASVDAGLSSQSFVKEFFMRCAQIYDPAVHRRPTDAAREVSLGLSPPGAPLALRHASCVEATHDGTTWTTVMAWQAWWDWHVEGTQLLNAGLPIPMSPPPGDRSEQAQIVRDVTALPGWWQQADDAGGGWLGMSPVTDRRSCWVSTRDHDAGHNVPPQDCGGQADQIQQALGLYHERGTSLVRYSFGAASARRLAGGDVARPTFADLGNRRFRVAPHCDRARAYAGMRWGTTHHIGGARATGPAEPPAGRPERAVRGVPIGELENLAIEALGVVEATPDTGSEEDFVNTLQPGERADVIARVRSMCRIAA